MIGLPVMVWIFALFVYAFPTVGAWLIGLIIVVGFLAEFVAPFFID